MICINRHIFSFQKTIKYNNCYCVKNLICEIFVVRLIEKQNRDVELKQLMKMSNSNFSNDLNDLIDLNRTQYVFIAKFLHFD